MLGKYTSGTHAQAHTTRLWRGEFVGREEGVGKGVMGGRGGEGKREVLGEVGWGEEEGEGEWDGWLSGMGWLAGWLAGVECFHMHWRGGCLVWHSKCKW